jgi:Tol biopolymer transport system component/predicted Ser/Thr protein kinase
MSLNQGAALLHYRLVDKLGEGGMGVVWTATDTTLDREVAIKVLPEALADHSDRLARFEREAKLLASLNHSNIAAVYGLHEGPDGERFIAMELVPGEDLSAILERGPLSVERTLAFAHQIAEALEAAHEQGVIHRDLKPANIVITPDDRVKVLDFGLAKTLDTDPASGGPDPSMSPTLTSAGTVAGMMLGTAAYMSPEQARGQAADKRADIWGFGCLLHEMLTGTRAFPGGTVTDTLAAVLTLQPDAATLPKDTPRSIRRLIERCTEKDVRRRLRDIGEARIAIEDAQADPSGAALSDDEAIPASRARSRASWLVAAVAGAVAVAAVSLLVLQMDAPEPQIGRFSIQFPYAAAPRYGDGRALAISPDGKTIVSSAEGGSDDQLYVRKIDDFAVRELTTARSARLPVFSPDGQWIGFANTEGLWKVNLAGGPPTRLGAFSAFPLGVTWSPDGFIYFVSSRQLFRVPDSGGEIEQIEIEELRSRTLWSPTAMASGKAILLSAGERANATLIAVDLEDNSVKELGLQGSDPRYLATGHLLFANNNQVFAVPFDADALEVSGTPVPVLPRVWIDGFTIQAAFSDNGTVIYHPASERNSRQMVSVDREGIVEPILSGTLPFEDANDPRFSPDGSKLAVSESAGPIWLIELASGTPTKLSENGFYPIWSPDGTELVYGTTRSTSFNLMQRPIDMSQPEKVLLDRENNLRTGDWAHDGTIVFREEIPGKGMDLSRWPDPDDESTIDILLDGENDELSPSVSPDGRWLAYASDQAGRDEIYVTRFPNPGGIVQVSVAGGANPLWSPDGRELYYFEGRKFISVNVAYDPEFRVVSRTTLFEGDFVQYRWQRQYDVHPDGERFVMISNPPGSHLEVVLDWFSELDRLVARNN